MAALKSTGESARVFPWLFKGIIRGVHNIFQSGSVYRQNRGISFRPNDSPNRDSIWFDLIWFNWIWFYCISLNSIRFDSIRFTMQFCHDNKTKKQKEWGKWTEFYPPPPQKKPERLSFYSLWTWIFCFCFCSIKKYILLWHFSSTHSCVLIHKYL